MARALYARHWSRAHALSSSAAGGARPALPGLAACFEALLQDGAPDLCALFTRLDWDPLKPALAWMAAGFVGFLEIEQTLLLWDRVVGYDSLLPTAVLAAGIFLFMRRSLLAASSGERSRALLRAPAPFCALPRPAPVTPRPARAPPLLCCGRSGALTRGRTGPRLTGVTLASCAQRCSWMRYWRT